MPLRSPKQKFLDSPHKEEFKKILNQPALEEALSAALLQFTCELPDAPSLNAGWDQAMQLAGIRKFISILVELPNPNPTPPKHTFANLKAPQ